VWSDRSGADRAPYAVPWDSIRLIVFDVDGTLYSQRPVRIHMAIELLRDALLSRTSRPIRVLSLYRKLFESLSAAEAPDFQVLLCDRVAGQIGVSSAEVAAIVEEWMVQRPLRQLLRARFPMLPELFAGIRRRGIAIGVLSDYPAVAKLAALGLYADHVLSADEVGRPKPDPTGLIALMDRAGVAADQTVFIGDRVERDGLAAVRAGVLALIRSSRPLSGWTSFAGYDDALFSPLLVEI